MVASIDFVFFWLSFFFFKQKTAYEMRISDWSSDVCSSDLSGTRVPGYGLQHGKLEAQWGYGSQHDGEHYRVHLCEPCFFRVLSGLRREIGRASWRERVCQYV